MEKPILIVGPASSGKTTKANEIATEKGLRNPLTIDAFNLHQFEAEFKVKCQEGTDLSIVHIHDESLLPAVWYLLSNPFRISRINDAQFIHHSFFLCILEVPFDKAKEVGDVHSNYFNVIYTQRAVSTIDSLTEKLSKYGTVEAIKEGVVFSLLLTGHEMSKMIKFQSIQKLVLDYTQDKYPYVEILQNSDTYVYMILKPNSQNPHEERSEHIMKPVNSIVSIEKYWKLFTETETYQSFSMEEKLKCRLGYNFGIKALYWTRNEIAKFESLEKNILLRDLDQELSNVDIHLNDI